MGVTNSNSTTDYYVGSATSHGLFTTFDGASYSFYAPGEHILLAGNIEGIPFACHILARHTSVDKLAVNLEAFSLSSGGTVLEVYGGSENIAKTFSNILIGGVLANINEAVIINGIFVCRQVSANHILITTVEANALQIDVYSVGRAIYITVQTHYSSCMTFNGLLSSCSGSYLDDFVTLHAVTLQPSISLNQTTIYTIFGQSYLVTMSSHFTREFQGHSALHFGRSSFVTDSHLSTFSSAGVTIELKLKSDGFSDCGTFLSYNCPTTAVTTFMVCNGFIAVNYKNSTKTLNIEIIPNTWYHISIVWQLATHQLKVYSFKEDESYVVDSVIFSGVNILVPGGSLMIGQWNTRYIDNVRLHWNFYGVIDDIRIWNDNLPLLTLRSNAWIYVDSASVNLVHYWRINEEHGDRIYDVINGIHMTATTTGHWQHPSWVYVHYKLSYRVSDILLAHIFPIGAYHPDTFCTNIFFDSGIGRDCAAMGAGYISKHHSECMTLRSLWMNTDSTYTLTATLVHRCLTLQTLTHWLPDPLCLNYPVMHQSHQGGNCDHVCLSGRVDEYDSCRCFDGYWGHGCTNYCTSHCAGLPCNKVYGNCTCKINYVADNDCSTCEPGWFGQDCVSALSSITNNGTIAQATVFGLANFLMFDGQTFTLSRAGEFIVYRNQGLQVDIRQGPCGLEGRYCVSQVAVTDHLLYDIVTIRASQNHQRSNYLLYVNGDATYFDLTYNISSDFSLIKLSSSVIRCVYYDRTVLVTSYPYYLMIQVTTSLIDCINSDGLLGNCDENINNDFRVNTTQPIEHGEVSLDDINNQIGKYCSICNAGFVYDYDEWAHNDSVEYTYNFYSIAINQSGIQSEMFVDVIDPDVNLTTLELRFRVDITCPEGAVILTYVIGDNSITLIASGALILVVNSHHYPLDFSVTYKWQHISIIYNKITGFMTIYHINHYRVMQHIHFHIQTNIFIDGGVLSLGSLPDIEGTFIGEIDEVRLWNAGIEHLYYVLLHARTDVNPDFSFLALQWKFIEGHGFVSYDSVSRTKMTLRSSGGIVWLVSTANILIDVIDYDRYSTWNDQRIKIQPYNAYCEEVTDFLGTLCADLGTSLRDFFYQSCVDESEYNPGSDVVLSTVNSYASYCLVVLNPVISPIAAVCSNFTYVSVDDMCSFGSACRFGHVAENDTCVCNHGYWGDTCAAICPGGVLNPCSNHGHCEMSTGICLCDPVWNGNALCSVCSDNWQGPECTNMPAIINDTTVGEPHHGSLYGMSHGITFHGSSFTLYNTGEFYLLINSAVGINIQVRLVPCYDEAVCLESIAIDYNRDILIIRSGYTSNQHPLIWYNGQLIYLTKTNFHLGFFHIKHLSTFSFRIASSEVNDFVLLIKQAYRHLTVTVSTPYNICVNQTSILGSCDPQVIDVLDSLASVWAVAPRDSLFLPLYEDTTSGYTQAPLSTSAGYSIYFDGTLLLQSSILNDVFADGLDFTVECYINPNDDVGVILNYHAEVSLSIYLNVSVHIAVSDFIINTNLDIYPGEWQHIILVYIASIQTFTLYIHHSHSGLTQFSFTHPYGGKPISGGYLTIGSALNVYTIFHNLRTHFYKGEIDELRVWNRMFTEQDIITHFGINIIGPETDLIALWKFNDGEGNVVSDIIGNSHFVLVDHSWIDIVIVWRYSTAPLQLLIRREWYFTDPLMHSEAISRCQNLVGLESILYTKGCYLSSLSIVYQVYCIKDVAASGLINTVDTSIYTIFAASDLCFSHLDLTAWPGKHLCTEFDTANFPVYFGDTCSGECYFRSLHLKHSDACQCYDGYWGADCKNVCPGGALNQCNAHGLCPQANGTCVCDDNWSGKACDICATGFIGSDCSIVSTEVGKFFRSASITTGGYWTFLDGTSVVFKDSGIFPLLSWNARSFRIEITQAPCSSFDICTVLCAIVVRKNVFVIDVRDPKVTQLYLNEKPGFFYGSQEHPLTGGFRLQRIDDYQLRILGPKQLRIDIYIQHGHLEINVRVKSKKCPFFEGLVTPCQEKKNYQCEDDDVNCLLAALGHKRYAKKYTLYHHQTLAYFRRLSINPIHSVTHFLSLYPQAARSALQVVGSAGVSEPVHFTSDVVTIEAMVNITVAEGTILCYSIDTIFGIAITDGNFSLHILDDFVVSGIGAAVGEWGHVSVVYRRTSGVAIIRWITASLLIKEELIFFYPGLCAGGGVITLGGWYDPISSSSGPPGIFIGTVDRVLYWSRPLSSVDLLYHFNHRIIRGEPGIAAYWRFNEGTGRRAVCVHSLITMQLSLSIVWTTSTSPIIGKHPLERYRHTIYWPNAQIRASAKAKCFSIFNHESQDNRCTKMAVAITSSCRICMINMAASGILSSSIHSTVTFYTVCQSYLRDVNWPAQPFCNEFPLMNFPLWIGESCDIPCVYGRPDPFDGSCLCFDGFWGMECQNSCPGIAPGGQPCENHGMCDHGTCICQKNWEG